MGLIVNGHGVYVVPKKVPERLQKAVAEVQGGEKARQVFLQKTTGTKSLKQAKVLAAPILIEFDGIIAKAEALLTAHPLKEMLSASEIERIGEYHYSRLLASHDDFIRHGPTEEREMRLLAADDLNWAEPIPAFGLTVGQLLNLSDTLAKLLPEAEAALARGDVGYVALQIQDLLALFRIRLNPSGDAYRNLGVAVLRAHVRGLRAIGLRAKGEPIATPVLPGAPTDAATGETLRKAFEGWEKARKPAAGTLSEYQRAVSLFTELHGDLPVAQLRKSHARQFRERLQEMPRLRGGKLAKMSFVELADWGKEHPDAQKISAGTVNKLLGGVQAVALWSRDNGGVADDIPWADPFANMRLEDVESERESFEISELNSLFASPVYSNRERPLGGKGEAAHWLPLLGLFTGARRGELAALTASNVLQWEGGTWVFSFVRDSETGKSLKTKSSARVVPVHPELVRLGWLRFIETTRTAGGANAWLFPDLSPEIGAGGPKAWTKWFSRYLRANGVPDKNKVFHSLRHNFKDALRAARTPEDLSDALTGHSNGSVGRGYGAKETVRRFGLPALTEAVAKVNYSGLDLSKVSVLRKRD